MAFRVPRRLNLGRVRQLSRHGGFAATLVLGVIAVTSVYAHVARAQTIVGGNKRPSVSVDSSVLDSLGTAPTLPQLFLDGRSPERATRPVATTRRTEHTRHVRTHRVAAAQTSSSLNHVIHLVPPISPVAAAAPATPAPVSPDVTASAPTTPPAVAQTAATALAAPVPTPAPMPSLPQSGTIPAPPSLPPEPAHVVVPAVPTTPPAPTVAVAAPVANPPAATPLAAAASPTSAPTPAPPTTVAMAEPPASAAAATPAPAVATGPPVQMAAATTVGGGLNAIKFAAGVTDLPPGPQAALDTVATRLLADDSLRVQVIAHASGTADEAMEARRVSLARAVAVRAYLIDKGVRSLRIDVRALGNRADEGPVNDEVDLMVVSQ